MAVEAKILLVLFEGEGRDVRSFGPELVEKGFHVKIVYTGRQARETLTSFQPDIIVLDTTHTRSSGVGVCRMIRAAASGVPIIYIYPAGRLAPVTVQAEVHLKQPFTIRKLVNRINRILPSVEGPLLQAGGITLLVERRALLKHQREHRLTPKQAQLLEFLMRHPGQVLSRRELMKHVWDTDYVDDTRTLDVHIRWVREAVEDNPNKPRYITTVRGKGYRFAVPPADALSAG